MNLNEHNPHSPEGNDRELLRYLNHEMNEEESREFEKLLQEDPFLEEAALGLMELDKSEIETSRILLDQTLKKQIQKEKKKKKHQQLLTPGFLALLIVFILLLIVISWMVIHQLNP